MASSGQLACQRLTLGLRVPSRFLPWGTSRMPRNSLTSYSCSAVTPCRSTIGPGETESRERLLPSTPLPWAGDPEMRFIRNLHLAGKGSGGWAQASITVNSVTCACVGSFLSCFALRPGNTCPNKYTYTSLYCSPLSETGKQVSWAELCPPTFLRRRPNLQYLRL